MQQGQQVVLTALRSVGIVENPWGSNEGPGFVDACQALYHMGKGTAVGPVPWCDCGAGKIFKDAGVDDHDLCAPGTWQTCARATELGVWLPANRLAGPGMLVVKCSVHIEIVVRERPGGLLDCIGCNVNQGIRETVRQRGGEWRVIAVPGLAHGKPEPVVGYGFDDPKFAPVRKGPYKTRAKREAAINKLLPDQRRLCRRIRRADGQFAFEILSGDPWRFGPWDRKARERVMAARELHFGRPMRPWRRTIPPHTDHGITSGETTT